MTHPWVLEPERRWWQSPVLWALALSAVIHAFCLVGWLALTVVVQQHPEWFPRWLQEAARKPTPMLSTAVPPPPESVEYRPQPDEREIPLSFIEVDPSLTVPDAPKNPRFQSTANTVAQNIAAPNPELNQPFIEGSQEKYAKTFNTDRSQPQPPPPAPAPTPTVEPAPEKPLPETKPLPQVQLAAEQKPPQEEKPAQARQEPVAAQAATAPPKGEVLQVAIAPSAPPAPQPKPAVAPRPAQPEQAPQEAQRAAQRRARKSLAQVRQEKGIIVGEQMKQEGGVQRKGTGSFDVSRGPMGEYGQRMWAAVQQKWYAILDERRFAGEHVGKVVVTFKLATDGTVMDVKAIEDSAGEGIYCETAIMVAASFGHWNNEMRSTYGSKPLDCTCVFWY